MSEALNSAELHRQHVELLPARTVLSSLAGGTGLPGADTADSGGVGAVIGGVPIGDATSTLGL